MEQHEFEEVSRIMARIASGDDAARFTLYERFGATIAAAMRRHVTKMGVHEISRDDLDGLTVEACMVIGDVAGSWSPEGGASPWHYAGARLVQLARVHVGQHAEELDPIRAARHDVRTSLRAGSTRSGSEPAVGELLASITASHEAAALLGLAFERVRASERDRHLLIEHTWQEAEGDRSPATTLAPVYGLTQEAVRQVVSRLRRKLRRLVSTDEQFMPLADLPLLA